MLKWADKELWRWGEFERQYLENSALGYPHSTVESALMDGTAGTGQTYGSCIPIVDMPAGVQTTERALRLVGQSWYRFAYARYVECKTMQGGWQFVKLDRLHHRFEVAYLIQNATR